MAIAMLAPQRVAGLCVIDIAPVRYTAVDGSDWRLVSAMHAHTFSHTYRLIISIFGLRRNP